MGTRDRYGDGRREVGHRPVVGTGQQRRFGDHHGRIGVQAELAGQGLDCPLGRDDQGQRGEATLKLAVRLAASRPSGLPTANVPRFGYDCSLAG